MTFFISYAISEQLVWGFILTEKIIGFIGIGQFTFNAL